MFKMHKALRITHEVRSSFWSRVARNAQKACWQWQGSKNGQGYGKMVINGKHHSAHRVAYIMAFGYIPEGHDVVHTCDNHLCVNPMHLKAQTNRVVAAHKAREGGK